MNFGFEITRTLCGAASNTIEKHAVIGRDEKVPAGFGQDRPPRAADAGIDHDHMNGAFGEIRPRFGDHEGGFGHVVRRDVMADIDDRARGAMPSDHAFHDAHKVVGKPEIRGKSDQPVRHVLIRL